MAGVVIEDLGTEDNRVQNNLIGTDRNLQPFRDRVQDSGVVITREARWLCKRRWQPRSSGELTTVSMRNALFSFRYSLMRESL